MIDTDPCCRALAGQASAAANRARGGAAGRRCRPWSPAASAPPAASTPLISPAPESMRVDAIRGHRASWLMVVNRGQQQEDRTRSPRGTRPGAPVRRAPGRARGSAEAPLARQPHRRRRHPRRRRPRDRRPRSSTSRPGPACRPRSRPPRTSPKSRRGAQRRRRAGSRPSPKAAPGPAPSRSTTCRSGSRSMARSRRRRSRRSSSRRSPGYYLGKTCHRLVKTATAGLIQCGSIDGTGATDPTYSFGPIENPGAGGLYPAGTIAMARAGDDAVQPGPSDLHRLRGHHAARGHGGRLLDHRAGDQRAGLAQGAHHRCRDHRRRRRTASPLIPTSITALTVQ